LAVDAARWYALWTHSHCEQSVCDQLAASGFEAFLPRMQVWSRRGGKQRLIPVPMFTGYLFVHHAIDKHSYVDILKTRGVVKILGERWDRLAPIPNSEIDGLKCLLGGDALVLPHPYLQEGQRVRIEHGPLAGLEGILVRSRPSRGLLVLSVELLRQSVAVELDCTAVVPIERSPAAAPRREMVPCV
jgi:transcription termination/antitermination protein NusG